MAFGKSGACEPEPNVCGKEVYAKPTEIVCLIRVLISHKKGLIWEVDMDEPRHREHVRGVGKKEQRQYEHIKEAAKRDSRYGGRAGEVAARTVLKHHEEKGHHKGQ